MEAKFEIGDVVRVKPRGHKMVVTFIYTPWGEDIYKSIYDSLKLTNPGCDFFYTCRDFKTGKPKDGVYLENILEIVTIKK